MRFGPNAVTMTVIKRAIDADGAPTGSFSDAYDTWAAWTQNAGTLSQVGGQREDPIDLVVRVNDSPRNRVITNGDRARIIGTLYQVSSVGEPERKSGSIPIVLSRKVNA